MEVLAIPAEVGRIDEARRFVGARARPAGLDDEAAGELELALTEALANVIEHAYRDAPGGPIELGVQGGERGLVVTVRDWGHHADPATFRRRDLDDPGDGGYGVFLMEELVDEMHREAAPGGGTLLTLIKHRKEQHHG